MNTSEHEAEDDFPTLASMTNPAPPTTIRDTGNSILVANHHNSSSKNKQNKTIPQHGTPLVGPGGPGAVAPWVAALHRRCHGLSAFARATCRGAAGAGC